MQGSSLAGWRLERPLAAYSNPNPTPDPNPNRNPNPNPNSCHTQVVAQEQQLSVDAELQVVVSSK